MLDERSSYAKLRAFGDGTPTVTAENGTPVPGPQVRWIGRRHRRRPDRRWSKAWGPQQIAARLLVDSPDAESMRISHV